MKNVLYEELCKSAIIDGSPLAFEVTIVLDEFFDSNVCIPKGAEVKVPIWNNGYAVCKVENLVIKLPEPEFEYQWLVINKNNSSVRDFMNYQNYMTVLEASNHYVSKLDTRIYIIVKIEETKRVRE